VSTLNDLQQRGRLTPAETAAPLPRRFEWEATLLSLAREETDRAVDCLERLLLHLTGGSYPFKLGYTIDASAVELHADRALLLLECVVPRMRECACMEGVK
jgi:hypothetical protein